MKEAEISFPLILVKCSKKVGLHQLKHLNICILLAVDQFQLYLPPGSPLNIFGELYLPLDFLKIMYFVLPTLRLSRLVFNQKTDIAKKCIVCVQ